MNSTVQKSQDEVAQEQSTNHIEELNMEETEMISGGVSEQQCKAAGGTMVKGSCQL